MSRKSEIDDDIAREIYAEYSAGATLAMLCHKYGHSYRIVRHAIVRVGGLGAIRSPGHHNVEQGSARKPQIDYDTARQIYAEYDSGVGLVVLCSKYDRHYKTIRRAICRIGGPNAIRPPGGKKGSKKKRIPLAPLPEPGCESDVARKRQVTGTVRDIAVLLRRLVSDREMTFLEISQITGITKSVVSDVLNGRAPVRTSDLDRLARMLDGRFKITFIAADGRELSTQDLL